MSTSILNNNQKPTFFNRIRNGAANIKARTKDFLQTQRMIGALRNINTAHAYLQQEGNDAKVLEKARTNQKVRFALLTLCTKINRANEQKKPKINPLTASLTHAGLTTTLDGTENISLNINIYNEKPSTMMEDFAKLASKIHQGDASYDRFGYKLERLNLLIKSIDQKAAIIPSLQEYAQESNQFKDRDNLLRHVNRIAAYVKSYVKNPLYQHHGANIPKQKEGVNNLIDFMGNLGYTEEELKAAKKCNNSLQIKTQAAPPSASPSAPHSATPSTKDTLEKALHKLERQLKGLLPNNIEEQLTEIEENIQLQSGQSFQQEQQTEIETNITQLINKLPQNAEQKLREVEELIEKFNPEQPPTEEEEKNR